jgi:hypothetical protein
MKVNGVVVPFAPGGPKGQARKRDLARAVRRQVPVDSPSMKVGGEVVPFTPGGPNGRK